MAIALEGRGIKWSTASFWTRLEERPAKPHRPAIRSRRASPRLVPIAIIVFYIVCAAAILGAPATPDFDIYAITSP